MLVDTKVQCMLCCRWFKTLGLHLHYKHDLTCAEYEDEWPGAETMSSSPREKIRASMIKFNKSDSHRAEVSARNSRMWKDPEWRKRESKERAIR